MKILVLTSRYSSGRDIVKENFGRQVRLFEQLKKLGHEIYFYVADYRKHETKNTKLNGINTIIRPFSILYFLGFIKGLIKTMKGWKCDVIVASSDPLWGIVGYFISRKFKINFVYDIQDDYSIYLTYKIPFLGLLERYVIKNSYLVTCASNILTSNVKRIRKKKTLTITNGVDTDLFKPLSKIYSRRTLKLPKENKIISYIGFIKKIQGIDILIKTFEELRKEVKDTNLLLAGVIGGDFNKNIISNKKGIIYLGLLKPKEVVLAINASDVLVIPYPKNTFTKVLFTPYKLVEYMACNKPIVITDVGEMHKHIKDKKMIAKAGDVQDLKFKIKYALKFEKMKYRDAALNYSWKKVALKLNTAIKGIKQH